MLMKNLKGINKILIKRRESGRKNTKLYYLTFEGTQVFFFLNLLPFLTFEGIQVFFFLNLLPFLTFEGIQVFFFLKFTSFFNL